MIAVLLAFALGVLAGAALVVVFLAVWIRSEARRAKGAR